MNVKICAILAGIQLLSTSAFAADDKKLPGPQPFNPFQGTPEEQAACRPDSNRFCREAEPDAFRVLACLQRNRTKISGACRRVLESHGQ